MSAADVEAPRPLSPRAIGASAAWFPEDFDVRNREIAFVKTDEETLAAHSFLDHRWKRDGAPHLRLRVDELQDTFPAISPGPLNFIWHTGFCCSTLLAKALNAAAHNLSLCEPQVLVTIADARRADLLPQLGSTPAVSALIFNLLARPFPSGSAITVKPAPAANILLPDAARRLPARQLFLYSGCREFLISIAKLAEEGRKYARRMFLILIANGHRQFRWPPAKLLTLSDLEIAALVWHMQIAEFQGALALAGKASVASLDCEAFEEQPEAVLAAVIGFFGLKPAEGPGSGTMQQSIFGQNAKQPGEPYDFRKRREEHESVARRLGADLDRIVAWSYGLCPSTLRDKHLPNPLVLDRNTVQA